MTPPEPTCSPSIAPHMYSMLWQIAVDGPLAAADLREANTLSANTVSNKLRVLIRLGLLERRPSGIYQTTEHGRSWLEAPNG
jgi:Mn-dependent DtxR family transcriptional regulator